MSDHNFKVKLEQQTNISKLDATNLYNCKILASFLVMCFYNHIISTLQSFKKRPIINCGQQKENPFKNRLIQSFSDVS